MRYLVILLISFFISNITYSNSTLPTPENEIITPEIVEQLAEGKVEGLAISITNKSEQVMCSGLKVLYIELNKCYEDAKQSLNNYALRLCFETMNESHKALTNNALSSLGAIISNELKQTPFTEEELKEIILKTAKLNYVALFPKKNKKIEQIKYQESLSFRQEIEKCRPKNIQERIFCEGNARINQLKKLRSLQCALGNNS